MINKVILVGNLGADPDVRMTQSGTVVCNLNLATTHSVKNGEQWEDKTEWHKVVLFGRLGEVAGEYLRKGSRVYIEGRIETQKWQDDEGNNRYTTQIIAKEMKMLSPKSESGAYDTGVSGSGDYGTGDDVPF